MPKSQVSPTLPIEFSEVCEVVYQDLLGTNGRTLFGCFAVANASGKTYDSRFVGAKDRLSNFMGFPVIIPGDSVYFDADYAVIEYNFVLPGDDLDTRTGIISPFVSGYLGYGRAYSYSNILYHGGDNRDQGVETVLINIANYKASYPTQNLIVDMRAWWWDILSTTPVVFRITLYKGGTPLQTGYAWDVVNPISSLVLNTLQKEMKLNVQVSATNGTTVGTFEYNPSTFITKVTPATDVTAPTVPTLTVQEVSNGIITLAWSGSTDANSPIKYCLWSLENDAGVALSPSKTQSREEWWDITTPFNVAVTNDVARHFYIRAYDPTGNYSLASNTVTATAVASDTTPPSKVLGLTVQPGLTTWMDLSWSAATDNVGVTGYVWNWSYDGIIWNLGGTTTQLSQVFIAPDTNTLYYFRVQAYDAAGNYGLWSNSISGYSGDIAQ